MVDLQILNKILKDKSVNILTKNNLTAEYFNSYSDEFDFIQNHLNNYGIIPDMESFLAKFPDFEVLNVNESESYLVDTIREEYLYSKAVPVLTKLSELMQTDSFEAVRFLQKELPNLTLSGKIIGTDIISNSVDRYNDWLAASKNQDNFFIPTGFQELDDIITGFHLGEELVVLFARTGQGKSWVMIKMLEHAWKIGKRVALLEPEMSANKVGYRFDTLHKNISNKALNRGQSIDDYENYITDLQAKDNPFFVSHPKQFENNVTVTKLKNWCIQHKIDILAIDGISYVADERKQKGDSVTSQLTHISEDLMQLSIDLNIPILVVVQSNRDGAKQDDLSVDNIRDSDGIAYNASLVLSIQQKEAGLQIAINKARNARAGDKLIYMWDIDNGKFTYIPNPKMQGDTEKAENLRRRYDASEEEF